MLRRLLVCFEISRPHNMVAAGLCVVAGYRVAHGSDLSAAAVAGAFAAVATGAGNIINDYFDLDIDRINKPRRPLPSGRLTAHSALILYAIVSAVLLAGAFVALPVGVAALVVSWHAALFAYAARLKRVFLAGNLLVAAITSSAFVAGGLLAGHPYGALVPFAIGFVFVLSRELVKGAEDVEGDRAVGVRTLAVVAGVAPAAATAAILMLMLAVLIPVPAIMNYYGGAYFIIMQLLVVPGLLLGAHLATSRRERRVFNRVSWILKAGMFFGILAVALGRV